MASHRKRGGSFRRPAWRPAIDTPEHVIFATIKGTDATSVEACIEGDATAVVAVDRLGRTALHMAAWSGNADFCSILLKHGADPNMTAQDAVTPLHFAAMKGREACVKLLAPVASNINATAGKRRQPALSMAARGGYMSVCGALIVAGADPTVCDRDGLASADIAAEAGHSALAASLNAAAKARIAVAKAITATIESEVAAETASASTASDEAAASESTPDAKRMMLAVGGGIATQETGGSGTAVVSKTTDAPGKRQRE